MHSAFLYHAIQAGLDFGIVNAGMLEVYEEIEPKLLEKVEAVLLNQSPDATEALIEYANAIKGTGKKLERKESDAWRKTSVEHAYHTNRVALLNLLRRIQKKPGC